MGSLFYAIGTQIKEQRRKVVPYFIRPIFVENSDKRVSAITVTFLQILVAKLQVRIFLAYELPFYFLTDLAKPALQ